MLVRLTSYFVYNALEMTKPVDIRFLTTFLEVAQTRHFGKAADNLYLTQSAVSARIKLLEEYFNTSLFVRNRNSIQLSPAGEKLVPYARAMASTLSDARKALSEADFTHLSCAATPNAFAVFVDNVLPTLEANFADISLRSDLAGIEQLSRQLHERSIDLAFTTEQLKSDDIISEKLTSVSLKLYGGKPQSSEPDLSHYIHIDWSPKITEILLQKYPECKHARFKSANYQVAVSFMEKQGGVALLPETRVPPSWHQLASSVEIKLHLYINYIQSSSHGGLKQMIEAIYQQFAEPNETVDKTGGQA